MKRLLLLCIILILLVAPAWADDCSMCPKNDPCPISYPLGWGNVIGIQDVWCDNGQWHANGAVRVVPVEGVDILINGNPFEVK